MHSFIPSKQTFRFYFYAMSNWTIGITFEWTRKFSKHQILTLPLSRKEEDSTLVKRCRKNDIFAAKESPTCNKSPFHQDTAANSKYTCWSKLIREQLRIAPVRRSTLFCAQVEYGRCPLQEQQNVSPESAFNRYSKVTNFGSWYD